MAQTPPKKAFFWGGSLKGKGFRGRLGPEPKMKQKKVEKIWKNFFSPNASSQKPYLNVWNDFKMFFKNRFWGSKINFGTLVKRKIQKLAKEGVFKGEGTVKSLNFIGMGKFSQGRCCYLGRGQAEFFGQLINVGSLINKRKNLQKIWCFIFETYS